MLQGVTETESNFISIGRYAISDMKNLVSFSKTSKNKTKAQNPQKSAYCKY